MIGEPEATTLSRLHESLRVLRERGGFAILGLTVLGLIVVGAIIIPGISPFDVNNQVLTERLNPPGWTDDAGQTHWFGTDSLGRDVFTRTFVGARYSLAISFSAVAGALLIGTIAGLAAGYLGGGFDNVIMRIVDLQLAFPVMLLSLVLVALLGTNLFNLVIVFVFTGWPIFARTIRASALALRQRGFVESARGLGAGRFRIMFRYILPNALGPLIVVATFEVAKVLIFESSLSFLSLGIQPPTPTWGNMMSEGRSILAVAWWVTFFPGIMLVLAAASSNIAGDGINAMVDPQVRRAR